MSEETRIPVEDMACLVDRWTVRYVRLLPVPVPRVWEAITVAEQMNQWFVPAVTLEARLGGRCTLSWGRAHAEAESWTVTGFEMRKRFELTRDGGEQQFLRFELEPVDAKTRFTFTNGFDRKMREDDLALAADHPDDKLLSLPAGLDTPIRAGILEGYHLMMDGFGSFLARDVTDADHARASEALVAELDSGRAERFSTASRGPSPLAELYYDYIREQCPPAS